MAAEKIGYDWVGGWWESRRCCVMSSRESDGEASGGAAGDGYRGEQLGAEVLAGRVGLNKEKGHGRGGRVMSGEGERESAEAWVDGDP
jgi:hypothetical protein